MSRLISVIALAALVQPTFAARFLQFASPLQTLTLPDAEVKETLQTKRQGFLSKYRVGLQAEADERRSLAAKRTKDIRDAALTGDDWADKLKSGQLSRRAMEEKLIEKAHDKAVSLVEKQSKRSIGKSSKKYQFVGVVNRKGEKPITWYARPKPENSKWSVRLVHVNRDAIIKDLFNQGKVDIFAKYKNTGKMDEETNAPIVKSNYYVKKRSWRNLWNFSPKHFFTDPSGMYWRERRLRPGLYTDGLSVYESSYRYSDGRNGMHRVSGFQQFLASKSVKEDQKKMILKKLKEAEPDIVLEL